MSDIDWENLRSCAFAASAGAYAPYSGFRVGAAAVTADGQVVRGCNVENVSLGLTLCAETVLVGNLFAAGGGRLRALVCCDADGAPLMPCGRCRQVLFEHGGPELLVDAAGGPLTMGELLPHAFGPDQWASGQLGSAHE
ncbi:cytidine deaminase [Tomitella biformata]|uniref:cytidine deaminase n=1 Tax=Tomitella biformata TaxID=630403 RepID=UPI0004641931|nr:cytidine deaminase [Tomitella biformata]